MVYSRIIPSLICTKHPTLGLARYIGQADSLDGLVRVEGGGGIKDASCLCAMHGFCLACGWMVLMTGVKKNDDDGFLVSVVPCDWAPD